MSAPKVSVCIDVYNYEAFLPEAIESVLRQDFTDFEVIVVDDCSKDRSYEIAQEYARKDSRVTALRNPANLGMVRNRNACLRPARGEYMKILHADDFFSAPPMPCEKWSESSMRTAASASSLARCNSSTPTHAKAQPLVVFSADRKPVTGTTVIARCMRRATAQLRQWPQRRDLPAGARGLARFRRAVVPLRRLGNVAAPPRAGMHSGYLHEPLCFLSQARQPADREGQAHPHPVRGPACDARPLSRPALPAAFPSSDKELSSL